MASNDPQSHLAGGPEMEGANAAPPEDTTLEEGRQPAPESKDWVARAHEIFEASKNWYDTNVRNQVERNLDNLANRHPSGSKYYLKQYLHRSKIFRPKLRTAQRECESAVVAAVFSNRELIQVLPQNENSKEAKAHSSVVTEMVRMRLEQPETQWFQTVAGAVFDAWSQSVIVSKQTWVKETIMVPDGTDEMGNVRRSAVKKSDRPGIFLLPIEYFFFHPSADWLDPINTSPYTVELMPMHVVDVQKQMVTSQVDGSVQPWKWHEQEQMLATSREHNDPTRRKREGRGQDSKGDNVTNNIPQHELVWIHVNVERDEFGVDWIWHTVGTELLLSEPVPLMVVYPHLRPGQRPYAYGKGVIEPHRNNPPAMTELAEGLQQAANEIQNSRFDNVRLAMNRRFRVRRGANVDLAAMRESVPGGAYEVEDVEKDVKEETVNDVTNSAYEEQNRISLDIDDMTGTFSQGSVQSNRQLNETVGGMGMLRASSGAQKEYQTRTIIQTWMYPALDQFTRMIQYYETDEALIAVAGSKARDFKRLYTDDNGEFQMPSLDEMDEALVQDMTVRLMIGMGAGDPITRVTNLMAGVEKLSQFPGMAMRINGDEIAKEVFASIGYDDGERFLHDDEAEEYQHLISQIQEMQQQIETKQIEAQGKVQLEQIKQEHQAAMKQAEMQFQERMEETKEEREREELRLQRDTLIWKMYLEEFDRRMKMIEFRMTQTMPQGNGDGRSGSPIGALPGQAGVMSRDQYGSIPNAQG